MAGTLGANRRREKDSHPTHTGKCMVNGKGFWISAWVKEGRDGSRFFSLSFKPMDQEQGRQQPRQEQAPARDEEFDDDIPF
jgi:hypothetical protein